MKRAPKRKPRTKLERHPFVGAFTYDAEIDAAYIYLGSRPHAAAKTLEVRTRGIYLDFDKSGRLLGIELLGQNLLPATLTLTRKGRGKR